MPQPSVDSRSTKDVLDEIAQRIHTLEDVLRLLTERHRVSEQYDPIPPFK